MTGILRTRLIGLTFLMLSASQVWAESNPAVPAVPAKDSFRLQFDEQGGFKLFRLDSQDGTAHALLSPNVDFPVTLSIFNNATSVALSPQAPEPNQPEDPGYRGPGFLAGDIKVQIWGIDKGPISTGWSVCRYEFQNIGKSIATISVRLVLDTWLGENTREHFSVLPLSDGSRSGIVDETQLLPQDWAQIIGSQRLGSADGFYLLLPSNKMSGVTPQRIVTANVRRLQGTQSIFDFDNHRAFNLLPFSINDSAIGIFYDSLVILPNQKISMDVIFSGTLDLDPARILAIIEHLSTIKPSISTFTPSLGTGQSANPNLTKRAEQMKKLNNMIDRLNLMLKDPHYRQGDLEKLIESIGSLKQNIQPEP